ncbi:hypothetical protein DEU56DRAFT_758298 [Suillus clintonianus]|uniref:uncharacterized protein n=1 Tax=Suillus clintonianus TaxID=1904413 RepID=UPI001B863EEC|nr:uncharacterized protein DEU56DRAFT_758298 [Suillus clintonianus]KAG2129022.1 hypothetical protein DEU56DRAFT_758298 [Suillus clintonianus]
MHLRLLCLPSCMLAGVPLALQHSYLARPAVGVLSAEQVFSGGSARLRLSFWCYWSWMSMELHRTPNRTRQHLVEMYMPHYVRHGHVLAVYASPTTIASVTVIDTWAGYLISLSSSMIYADGLDVAFLLPCFQFPTSRCMEMVILNPMNKWLIPASKMLKNRK